MTASERAAGELVADVDTLTGFIRNHPALPPRDLAEALVAAGFGRIDAARREALRVARQVESDMSEQALRAWRSADARRGLSDHTSLLVHADALTRWSERFRMAFDGDYYATDTEATS